MFGFGREVICCDRSDGQVRWRHKCDRATLSIAAGGGRVFCAELVNVRRGEAVSGVTRTRALDLSSGEVLWEIDGGAAIRYSEAYDLLATAKGIYKGLDGTRAGDTSGFDRMHGNQACDLLSLVDDRLLWGTVTSYAAYDLLSGTEVDDDTIGVLGVIGPTRMAYDRVVPIVDVTAKMLSAALSK